MSLSVIRESAEGLGEESAQAGPVVADVLVPFHVSPSHRLPPFGGEMLCCREAQMDRDDANRALDGSVKDRPAPPRPLAQLTDGIGERVQERVGLHTVVAALVTQGPFASMLLQDLCSDPCGKALGPQDVRCRVAALIHQDVASLVCRDARCVDALEGVRSADQHIGVEDHRGARSYPHRLRRHAAANAIGGPPCARWEPPDDRRVEVTSDYDIDGLGRGGDTLDLLGASIDLLDDEIAVSICS